MIPEDLLAPYRKKPLATAPVAAPPDGKPEYVAFAAKDNVPCLRIRCKNFLACAVGYNLLLSNTYDDDKGCTILLCFTVMRVKIEGRNLQNLVHALNTRKAECLLEYDPDRWAMPTEVTAPFIESIEVVINGASVPVRDSNTEGQAHGA